MNQKIQKIHEFIGDIKFRVDRRRFSDIPLWPIFLKGYGLTVCCIMGIRCLFFINAAFADGVVINHTSYKTGRELSVVQMVSFETNQKREMLVPARRILYLKAGERVRVVYKINNPSRAIVFTYAGFWANAVVLCGIALLFWVGFPLAYFGFDDE